MYRLMIVDDNPWDRRALQEIIDWDKMGIEIIGTYSNGRQALEKIDELRPHIILTDIAMPVMNGIQFAEKIKETHPDIKIIFLSVYNDFSFAKSAIDLDIYGYVLKPVMPEALSEALKKVLNIYETEESMHKEKEQMLRQLNDSLPLVQEQFLRELLFGNYTDLKEVIRSTQFLRLDFLKGCSFSVLYMEIKEYESRTSCLSITEKYMIPYTVKNIVNMFTTQNIQLFTVQITGKEYAVIAFCKYKPDQVFDTDILDIAVGIHEKVSSRLHLYMTIGISRNTSDLLSMPELFTQSVNANNTRFYGEGNPIILYDEIEEILSNSIEGKVNMEILYKEVKFIISSGNRKKIGEFIDRYFNTDKIFKSENYIKSLTFSIINAVQIALIEANQSFQDIFDKDTDVWEKLNHFETILDVKQWLSGIFQILQDHFDCKINSRYGKIVEDVKEIVKNRYHEPITLGEIADAVYLSSKQLNIIFKKETGRTIFDYIIEYRMEAAKKMLKDPYEKVYLVAEKVGYTNKSHFCLLFKKFTGLSPLEYKNKAAL